jgi:hypothetical protein
MITAMAKGRITKIFQRLYQKLLFRFYRIYDKNKNVVPEVFYGLLETIPCMWMCEDTIPVFIDSISALRCAASVDTIPGPLSIHLFFTGENPEFEYAILIPEIVWDEFSEATKKFAIYHELGHIVLKHLDDIADGCELLDDSDKETEADKFAQKSLGLTDKEVVDCLTEFFCTIYATFSKVKTLGELERLLNYRGKKTQLETIRNRISKFS